MAKILSFPKAEDKEVKKRKIILEKAEAARKISFSNNPEPAAANKYGYSLPWNDLVVPILLCAICFGVLMGIISFALFGADGYYYQLSSTGIGIIAGLLLPLGIIFFIWLTRKMYPFNTI